MVARRHPEIVFVSKRDSPADLFVMAADATSAASPISPELEGRPLVTGRPKSGLQCQPRRLLADLRRRRRWREPPQDHRSHLTTNGRRSGRPTAVAAVPFERDSRTNPGIYLMRPDGSDARLIYNGPYEEWGATWSADGSQIIFAINEPGDVDNLYIMDATAAARALTG